MLELKNIVKIYKTGDFVQRALDGVSLCFRENEFVSILGQSGSGKTTMLNIIGGLDRYDEGDLVINGVSTKEYKDGDWDSYRNHKIGFVFQSYNLIPHQSVLANVELALTLSGVSKSERKKRAAEMLEKVGLWETASQKAQSAFGRSDAEGCNCPRPCEQSRYSSCRRAHGSPRLGKPAFRSWIF